jgi:hypothetical protein
MDEPAIDPPQRRMISSRAELADALLHLIGRARRALRFAAADLSVFELSGVQATASLRKLLVTQRTGWIHLLVDDMRWLDSRAPRLRALQRDFPHALLIRQTDPQDAVGEDVVAIGDAADALRLQPTLGTLGELWCNNGPFVQPLLSEFDRRWERASHNQAAQPLGL